MRRRLRPLLPRLHLLPPLNEQLDQWAEWLVRTRFAGWPDEEVAAALEELAQKRDRVLDAAGLEPGAAVADVGAGTGLLTLGAVERVGPDGDVIALDVSVDALEELRANTAVPNISYLVGQADVLPLRDASVEAVVTRSVLIYVDDKAEAAREFSRVLRSGGRVSLFEPINSRNLLLTRSVDFSPLGDLGDRLRTWNEAFYEHTDAGLADVQVELGADEHQIPGERYLNQVGAPGRPTLLERWRDEFAADDVERLAAFVTERTIPARFPYAFLAARKP